MAHALAPDTVQRLMQLSAELAEVASIGGARDALVGSFARLHDCSASTVYRWLKEHAGWQSGRKRRADAGTTRLPSETLEFVAASTQQSVRANGISTKPICVAMNIAHENGLAVNVTAGRVAALLRAHRLDLKTQAQARNHQRLRSLHPNHVHQIDPSLCLVYYLGGRQYIMDERQFNKNKPVAYEKVRLKTWRYTRYDHASRSLDVGYFEAAGENQASLFEFLLHTWGRSETRLSHGVPRMLLWDKGSAMTSSAVCRLLDALGVDHRTHATGHAWAKGGVESANWIVERHFESRLRDEPVDTVEQLNASASAWVRDYNANAMAHIDSRVRGDDGQMHVRDDLWSLIAHHPGALVEMPEREVCAWFMRGKDATRQVRDGHITFVHPQSRKSELYNLQAWAKHFANGQTLRVSPLLLGDCLLRVELDQLGGETLHVDVEPERAFDAYGRPMSATVLGEEYGRAPHTAAEEAAKRIAQAAYGAGTSLDDAEKRKGRNERPFMHMNDGRGVVAHSHLGKGELPARLLPEAQPVVTDAVASFRPPVPVVLPLEEGLLRLRRGMGRNLRPDEYAFLAARHAEGIPEDQIDALIEQYRAPAMPQEPVRAAGGLRAV